MADIQDDHVITVSCATEYPAYRSGEDAKCWGLVTLTASRYETEESKRPALDIVAVIDKSGSMEGEKLFLVKKSLEFLVQNLLKRDRLSVITYDTHVYINFDLLVMNNKNKEYARKKIRQIQAGSGTNLCAGLLQGLCQVLDGKGAPNGVASVLLFTDGLANEGITKKSKIIKAMKNPKKYLGSRDTSLVDDLAFTRHNQRASTQPLQLSSNNNVCQQQAAHLQSSTSPQQMSRSATTRLSSIFNMFRAKPVSQPAAPSPPFVHCETDPVSDKEEKEDKQVKVDINASVYTFGFGADHDPDLLKAISDAANGMYFYIENDEQISESFGHCFGGLVSTLAQNIKLTLKLCDGVTVNTIHTDREATSDAGLREWCIKLGDLQSEEGRDVLVTLNLPQGTSSSDSYCILNASASYFCVVDNTHKNSQAEMVVQRSEKVEYSPSNVNPGIDRQRNRILTTKAIEDAVRMADSGGLDLARRRLTDEIKRVKESLTGKDEFCKILVKDMEQCLLGLRDKSSYEISGRKAQINISQMHSKQRSNRAEMNLYSTSSHMEYQERFK